MEDIIARQKCTSLQAIVKRQKEISASNTSAPFSLHCLKNNHKFIYEIPVCDLRPSLLIDSIVNEADMVNVIKTLQFDVNKKQSLGDYLVKKGVVDYQNVREKEFLMLLIEEAIDYAAQKDFTAFQLACFFNIYISSHYYMKSKYWRQPREIWDYFKEVLICHTIEDSPDGQDVFSAEDSYDILSHFHTIYMNNLPLVHTLVFGAYKQRFVWPFN